MTARRRKAAARPPARTIEVELTTGEFAGWAATARADFPARLVLELESGNVGRIVTALAAIIVDHNMPAADGSIAADLLDVDPIRGLIAVSDAIGDKLLSLPNR